MAPHKILNAILNPRRSVSNLRSKYRIPTYNLSYRLAGSLDSYPFPPSHLINLVIGTKEIAWYQLGGLFMHQSIGAFLGRNGTPIESLKSILDFGCGCGRILRWWAALKDIAEIWGCDYNPQLIEWCQMNLSSIASFKLNGSDPPLDFEERKFEFAYAYSVFTHFSADRQQPWMEEMVRVLKPGGLLLLTVHGKRVAWRSGFSEELLRKLDEQGILVFGEDESGSNLCAAYHSENFMKNQKSIGLELVDFVPGGVRDSSEQDMYLYRKFD
jgi:SAM-dependent methyltransferase